MPRCRTPSCLALAILLATGCGRPTPPPEPSAAAPAQPKPPPPVKPQDPADPAAAVRQAFADLAAGRSDSILAAIPKSYRTDLDRWLAESIRSLDPAARRDVAVAVAEFAETLRAKREFVLNSERFEIAGPAAGFVRDDFDALCRIVASLARWPGWGGAEEISAEPLIAMLVEAVAADPLLVNELRTIRVETLSRSGDHAVVRLRTAEESGVDLPLVQVQGNWIPETVADRWKLPSDAAALTQADIATRNDQLRQWTPRLREMTTALDSVATQPEFDALADQAATLLLATAAQAETAPRPVRDDEFVTVVIRGDLTDQQKDRLTWELASRTDAPASGLADATDTPDGGGMTVTVGPVADLDAFAKRLPGVQIEQIDPNARRITLSLIPR